jgi:enamine deaminase RidA (YjgF/YER057c/UK114 family)
MELEMSTVEKINPDTLAPTPEGKHAHIVITPPGARTAYIAGQVALDRDLNIVGSDLDTQARQCFENIKLALEALKAKADQVVQMTIIVVDYDQSQLSAINGAGEAVFGDQWPVTATTLIGAQALGHSAFLVEVNAIVALYD